jgi:hypothetical protein
MLLSAHRLLHTSAGETWRGWTRIPFLKIDLICGIQLKEQTSWRFQKTRRFEKSINPEVWFVRDWPAVRSGRASAGS